MNGKIRKQKVLRESIRRVSEISQQNYLVVENQPPSGEFYTIILGGLF